MKPLSARNRISEVVLVTLITLISTGAMADFQGIDTMHRTHTALTDQTDAEFSFNNMAGTQEIDGKPVQSRLLESSYTNDAMLYTLGLDFLANNYLAVRRQLERWLSLDNPAMNLPTQNGTTESNTINSGLRFVF